MTLEAGGKGRLMRRGRRLGVLRAFALLFRVFVVLVAVELSGVAALAQFASCRDECAAGSCADCPLEKQGKECPPGCPNYHCAHGGSALPPVFERLNADIAALDVTLLHRPDEAGVPLAPPLPGVYRPPCPGSVFPWTGQRSA